MARLVVLLAFLLPYLSSPKGDAMACERGQAIHEKFERAVNYRTLAQGSARLRDAQMAEDFLILERAAHVSKCLACWNDPPRSKGRLPVNPQ